MTFQLTRGSAPLLVSIPHMGTEIPSELRGGFVPRALAVEDADWHLDRLYDFAAVTSPSRSTLAGIRAVLPQSWSLEHGFADRADVFFEGVPADELHGDFLTWGKRDFLGAQ